MIWLLAYFFIGAVYAAFATNWMLKNSEAGSSFLFGFTCCLLWPFLIFMTIIMTGDDG